MTNDYFSDICQMLEDSIPHIRNDYSKGELDLSSVHGDPILQFREWMEAALAAGIEEPTAMTLATADASGKPSARMVLLKGFDRRGFVFFTNFHSRKGREITENPRAALVLYWKEMERQVRIEGTVSETDPSESDEYFRSRPRESQAGAIVSPQSQVIQGRRFLEEKMQEILKSEELTRPANWGGYRLAPVMVEFWQGRPGRLHDRIRYTLEQGKGWKIERLAP